ncbi:hypothetical protein [Halobacteriovorax sp. JY17]|uniref:hypothetical protein n=1 Tax=Halobacteriovorax sp. JY17 TaxID=2014617 RepID=UPI000C53C49C|nr:hypothetical protein [Halobacteriovorax sp. JY17]PIK14206.1 MAG: hypothetical protein CES88_14610 [Halobacteriovorax sp. JY17]
MKKIIFVLILALSFYYFLTDREDQELSKDTQKTEQEENPKKRGEKKRPSAIRESNLAKKTKTKESLLSKEEEEPIPPTNEEVLEHLQNIFSNTYENVTKKESLLKAEVERSTQTGNKKITTYNNKYENSKQPVDILWVIDDSGSMKDKIKEVSEKIDLFLNQFIEKNVSFKIAVVNTSRELLHDGSILNSINYRDDRGSFNQTISEAFNLSVSGNGEEQGFWSISDFLDSSGEKFFRENSKFIIIVISDEDDGSFVYDDGRERLMKTQSLLDKIQQYKTLENTELYSIVSFPPHVAKIAGIRYAEMSYLTKGLTADIKSDFHQTLLNIGGRITTSKKEETSP